nr:carboxypeptidase-like regulatory domain-containing protein [uncultured Psychroserpens sp.]
MEITKIKLLFLVFAFCKASLFAQSISGIVLDANTNDPIESASVYFDNTTIGTSTNDKGSFTILVEPSINSPLIISFLGYEKIVIPNYSANKYYKILLVEDQNALDEVHLTYFDGMPKDIKIKHFREQFLGNSINGKSCKILNEDDLLFRFNKKTKQLVVSSKRPIHIKNENLQYDIEFDIRDFVIDYSRVNLEKNIFRIQSVVYKGTSFFKSLDTINEATIKNRKLTYEGSVLHFMRALSNENLLAEGYQVFSNGFVVEPSNYINVRRINTLDSVKVKLRLPLSVLYNNELQSSLISQTVHQTNKKNKKNTPKVGDTIHLSSINQNKSSTNSPYYNTEIIVDGFGNYSPIGAFYFTGYMSRLRVGDTLPLDYNLLDD